MGGHGRDGPEPGADHPGPDRVRPRPPRDPVGCVGESAWPGRTGPELTEAIKQDALANLAFRAMPVTALCPFDRTGLPPGVLALAGQVHPLLTEHGTLCPSPAYLGADGMPQPCLQPLPDPPADAEALHYQQDMH